MTALLRIGLVTAALTAGVGVATAGAEETDGCETATILMSADLVSHAITIYEDLLAEDDPPPCALPGYNDAVGLQNDAETLVDEGEALATVGRFEDALAKFDEALAIDGALLEAVTARDDAIAALDEPDATGTPECTSAYAPAERLLDAGYDDEARAKAQEIADSTECAIPSPLTAEDDPAWRGDWTSWLTDAAGLVGAVLAALALAGFILWLAAQTIRRGFRESRPLVFATIEDPPSGHKVGADLTITLADQVAGAGRDPQIHGYISYQEAPEVGDIELPTQLKPVGQFVKWLRAPRTIQLRGAVFHPGRGRIGLKVRLVDHRQLIIGEQSFHQPLKADAEAADVAKALGELTPQAAAWIRAELARVRKDKTPRLIGTTNWRSYAAFSRGVQAAERGSHSVARLQFQRALQYDGENWAALYNIGQLDTDRALTEVWSKGDKLAQTLMAATHSLERVQAETRDATTHQRRLLWYRATYLLGIASLNLAAGLRSERGATVPTAKERTAVVHAWNAAHALHWRVRDDLGRSNDELNPVLRTFESAILTLRIGATAEVEALEATGTEVIERNTSPPPATYDALMDEFEAEYPPPIRAPESLYNLACNIVGRRDQFPAGQPAWYDAAMNQLEVALAEVPAWRPEVAYDPALRALVKEPMATARLAKITKIETKAAEAYEPPSTWTLTINAQ